MYRPPMPLIDRARALSWYHTLELSPGNVTDGIFDLRPVVDRYGLPPRLDGMRALDVGTFDGFWAFEMERRGAEVVALDVDDERDFDWPPTRARVTGMDVPRGEGFKIAKEALGSSVERIGCSIYDAKPEDLGTFDLVFCASVIIHLRDQFLAFERIGALCRNLFISAEAYNAPLSLLPIPVSRYRADRPDKAVVFWEPTIQTWSRMLRTAGFPQVQRLGRFKLRAREGWSVRHVVHRARKSA